MTLSTSRWSLHGTWASLSMAVGSERGVSRESIARDTGRNFKVSHALAAEVTHTMSLRLHSIVQTESQARPDAAGGRIDHTSQW